MHLFSECSGKHIAPQCPRGVQTVHYQNIVLRTLYLLAVPMTLYSLSPKRRVPCTRSAIKYKFNSVLYCFSPLRTGTHNEYQSRAILYYRSCNYYYFIVFEMLCIGCAVCRKHRWICIYSQCLE